MNRPQKITLAEMRASGVRGILIYCSDYHCSHWTAISAKGLINLVLWLGIFQEVVVRKSPRYCRDQQSANQRLFNDFCYSY